MKHIWASSSCIECIIIFELLIMRFEEEPEEEVDAEVDVEVDVVAR